MTRFIAHHPYRAAALTLIAAFFAAVALHGIEPDVSISCTPDQSFNYECTSNLRPAWIDWAAVIVLLNGIAGAATIIVRRTRSGKAYGLTYTICLGVTVALYATVAVAVAL